MVALRFLAILALCVALASCNNETETPETLPDEAVAGLPAVSANDAEALASAPSVDLKTAAVDSIKLRLKVGDKFHYRLTQSMESIQDSINAKNTGVHEYTLRVKGVRSDGSYEVGMVFTSITMNLDVVRIATKEQVAKTTYRSSDSADRNNPQNIQFTALLNEEATVVLSPAGSVLEVSGILPIVNKVLKSAPPERSQNPQFADQIRSQIENAMFVSFLTQQMVPFPEGTVDEDKTWTRDQLTPMGQMFIINSKTKYTINEIKVVNGHQIATVSADFNGSVKLAPPPKDATTKIVLNKSKLTGSSSAVLDLTTGMTISKKNQVKMDIQATASAPEFGRSQVLSQQQETRFTIELIR